MIAFDRYVASLLAITGCYLPASANAEDVVAYDVRGHVEAITTLGPTVVALGSLVPGDARIRLGSNSLIGIEANGRRHTMRGPGEHAVAPFLQGPTANREQKLLGEAIRNALRSYVRETPSLKRPETLDGPWTLSTDLRDSVCVEGALSTVHMAGGARQDDLEIVVLPKGKPTYVPFDLREKGWIWPVGLTIADGQKVQLKWQRESRTWTIRFKPEIARSPTETIDWLVASRCFSQAMSYVQSFEPQSIVGGN